jgi:hypothetical protein
MIGDIGGQLGVAAHLNRGSAVNRLSGSRSRAASASQPAMIALGHRAGALQAGEPVVRNRELAWHIQLAFVI